jgi:hypothetical protein
MQQPDARLIGGLLTGAAAAALCSHCASPEPEPEPGAGTALEPEPAALRDEDGYSFALHPPPAAGCRFPIGTDVYAQLKAGVGSQGWARAVVTACPTPNDAALSTGQQPAEHSVRVLAGCGPSARRRDAGIEVPVPGGRLIDVRSNMRVVLAAETDEFRRLTRAHSTADDFVVDIGCSYGEGTKLIAAECPNILGLELVASVVEAARERHPGIRFEQCDCLAETERSKSTQPAQSCDSFVTAGHIDSRF